MDELQQQFKNSRIQYLVGSINLQNQIIANDRNMAAQMFNMGDIDMARNYEHDLLTRENEVMNMRIELDSLFNN